MCIDKPVPHKHADSIKAWADGHQIQVFHPETAEWVNIGTMPPNWLSKEYRIKPKPKVKKYRWLLKDSRNKNHLSVSFDHFKDLSEANLFFMNNWYIPVEQIDSTMQEFDE